MADKPQTATPKGSGGFNENFKTLQRNAELLRDQREPNIDDLLEIVQSSVAAYRVCTARIDAVEKALDEALSAAGSPDGDTA